MTTDRHVHLRDTQRRTEGARPTTARAQVSGDELFVPATHGLVVDRQVSHAAFRLWCVLHRLWFLREPPAMELLQELMGTSVERGGGAVWQPATRRSVERWLGELEAAGWLVWTRRAVATQRYHLRTSARNAGDGAVLGALRALLNSGKATLGDVQALLATAADTTVVSHDPIMGSQQDGMSGACGDAHATPESHHAILPSHLTTTESHDRTLGSHHATPESHHATPESDQVARELTLMGQNHAPTHENRRHEPPGDPTPPPSDSGGGGGATATAQFLIRQGFSARAAQEFRDLDCAVAQAEVVRRQALGQGP